MNPRTRLRWAYSVLCEASQEGPDQEFLKALAARFRDRYWLFDEGECFDEHARSIIKLAWYFLTDMCAINREHMLMLYDLWRDDAPKEPKLGRSRKE